MQIRLKNFSFRFAEQVLNSRLSLKQEIDSVLTDPTLKDSDLTRPGFNSALDKLFVKKGWERQPHVFEDIGDPGAKLDFLKDRIGVEVEFGHASFIGIDLLKFQVASYSALNRIDLGVYITTTKSFQKAAEKQFGHKWEGSLSFEKVQTYLPHFKSAIQVPIFVIGIDA